MYCPDIVPTFPTTNSRGDEPFLAALQDRMQHLFLFLRLLRSYSGAVLVPLSVPRPVNTQRRSQPRFERCQPSFDCSSSPSPLHRKLIHMNNVTTVYKQAIPPNENSVRTPHMTFSPPSQASYSYIKKWQRIR